MSFKAFVSSTSFRDALGLSFLLSSERFNHSNIVRFDEQAFPYARVHVPLPFLNGLDMLMLYRISVIVPCLVSNNGVSPRHAWKGAGYR